MKNETEEEVREEEEERTVSSFFFLFTSSLQTFFFLTEEWTPGSEAKQILSLSLFLSFLSLSLSILSLLQPNYCSLKTKKNQKRVTQFSLERN